MLLKVQKVSSTENVEKNAVIVKKTYLCIKKKVSLICKLIRKSQILLVLGLSPRTKFAYSVSVYAIFEIAQSLSRLSGIYLLNETIIQSF